MTLTAKQKADLESVTRVYSVVELKSIDEEKREFTGIATTPGTDRMGDIVEPMGAEFVLPIPLLWQHDRSMPVGTITVAKAKKGGIEVRGSIPAATAPAGLAARLEEAWQSLKLGLVRGLSIGFSPLEYSFMDNGGIHFTKWAWHELSLVTIPANAEATVTSIKSFDSDARAASGRVVVVKHAQQPAPGVTGKYPNAVSMYKAPEGKTVNIQEQIKGYEKTREEKVARQKTLMEKASAEGRTLDAAEAEEYDTLAVELKAVDAHLIRLKEMEAVNVTKATAVAAAPGAPEAPFRVPAVARAPLAEKGIALAQAVKFLGRAQGNRYAAWEMAKEAQGVDPRSVAILKAAVAAGVTTNGPWAGNLVGDETSAFADFVEFLRPETILGKFGTGNIPSLRTVPFRIPLIGQTSGGAGYWVGEGKPKPLTKFDFARTTLEPLKVANIAVLSEEVIRDSSPKADVLVRDGLVAALKERLDIDFIDPTKSASSGVSPASITNGLTPVVSSGTNAEAVRNDLRNLFASFIAANNAPKSAVLIMSATTALALSLMQNPLGQTEFPGIGMGGGILMGIPVIVSEYVPSDSDGHIVIMVNASDIYLGDEGGFAVDFTREASLQMSDTPDNPVSASTVMVSLFQHNLVGFRAERTINWSKRRASAVSYVSGVNWGAGA